MTWIAVQQGDRLTQLMKARAETHHRRATSRGPVIGPGTRSNAASMGATEWRCRAIRTRARGVSHRGDRVRLNLNDRGANVSAPICRKERDVS